MAETIEEAEWVFIDLLNHFNNYQNNRRNVFVDLMKIMTLFLFNKSEGYLYAYSE